MQVDFDLLMPETLPEALALLAEMAPDLTPIAGGTNVIVNMREDRHRYQKLMDLNRIGELHGIRKEDDRLVIGSTTTLARVLEHPLVREHALPLMQAASVFANPLVRNRATVGGNLVDASPAADTAPPLLAMDANVLLASKKGFRQLPLHDFMVGVNKTLCQPDELLVSIRCPIPAGKRRGGFKKAGLRKGTACSIISAAVMVECDEDGICQKARIALGAAAPRPIRAEAAEELLAGQRLTPQVIAEAGRLCAQAASPIDDIRGSAEYRRRMVEVIVRRLLADVADHL
jgi:CO/xanthine dehydrogenase FAD-binding subunit